MSKVANLARLEVTYQTTCCAHEVQKLYFDDDFMLRRLDYVTTCSAASRALLL